MFPLVGLGVNPSVFVCIYWGVRGFNWDHVLGRDVGEVGGGGLRDVDLVSPSFPSLPVPSLRCTVVLQCVTGMSESKVPVCASVRARLCVKQDSVIWLSVSCK